MLHYINQIKKHVSYELLLSGYVLEQAYQALLFILQDKDMSSKAISEPCDIFQQALTFFCNVLGRFAGNLAIIMNTQDRVYIASGIVPRFID